MKVSFFIAAALSLIQAASAANAPVFVGCYAPGLLEGLLTSTLGGLVGTVVGTTQASCNVSLLRMFSIFLGVA